MCMLRMAQDAASPVKGNVATEIQCLVLNDKFSKTDQPEGRIQHGGMNY